MNDVLIVDAKPELRQVCVEHLETVNGIGTVLQCSNAAIAQSLIEKSRPALVIADLYMSNSSGLALLQQIRKNHPGMLVLIMSSQVTRDIAIECVRLGAFDFIEKPFQPVELVTSVERAFRELQIREELCESQRAMQEFSHDLVRVNMEATRKLAQCLLPVVHSAHGLLVEGDQERLERLLQNVKGHLQTLSMSFSAKEIDVLAVDELVENALTEKSIESVYPDLQISIGSQEKVQTYWAPRGMAPQLLGNVLSDLIGVLVDFGATAVHIEILPAGFSGPVLGILPANAHLPENLVSRYMRGAVEAFETSALEAFAFSSFLLSQILGGDIEQVDGRICIHLGRKFA